MITNLCVCVCVCACVRANVCACVHVRKIGSYCKKWHVSFCSGFVSILMLGSLTGEIQVSLVDYRSMSFTPLALQG